MEKVENLDQNGGKFSGVKYKFCENFIKIGFVAFY